MIMSKYEECLRLATCDYSHYRKIEIKDSYIDCYIDNGSELQITICYNPPTPAFNKSVDIYIKLFDNNGVLVVRKELLDMTDNSSDLMWSLKVLTDCVNKWYYI